jgi:PhoPQ-activated pathogenicity-related protein
MENLTNKQKAALYLLLFNISEAPNQKLCKSKEELIKPIDSLLIHNNCLPDNKVIYDEDGAPANETQEIMTEFQYFLDCPEEEFEPIANYLENNGTLMEYITNY